MRAGRRLAAGLVATALLLATAACGDSDPNADAVNDDGSVDLSKVTLRVGDQKGGARALLTAAGELDDVPYEIEWSEFTSGPPLVEALAADSIDVGSVGNTPPLFAAAQKKDVTAVLGFSLGAKGDAIVVPDDSDLQSVADLEGRTVAVAEGSSANYNLMAQLAEAGLSMDDVEVKYLQPPDALAAFKGGFVDAWAIWDPYTAQAEVEEDARVLADGAGVVNGNWFQVASDPALDSEATTAALEDYLARIETAQAWSNDHRDEWGAEWADATGLDPAVTDHAAQRRTFTPLQIDDDLIASEQEMYDAFVDAGQIPEAMDVSDYFSPEFNDLVPTTAGAAR